MKFKPNTALMLLGLGTVLSREVDTSTPSICESATISMILRAPAVHAACACNLKGMLSPKYVHCYELLSFQCVRGIVSKMPLV